MTDREIEIKALVGEVHNLKKNFAIKLEEIQALYIEVKLQRNLVEKYQLENKHLRQQIKQLGQEAEEMMLYPWLFLEKLKAIGKC